MWLMNFSCDWENVCMYLLQITWFPGVLIIHPRSALIFSRFWNHRSLLKTIASCSSINFLGWIAEYFLVWRLNVQSYSVKSNGLNQSFRFRGYTRMAANNDISEWSRLSMGTDKEVLWNPKLAAQNIPNRLETTLATEKNVSSWVLLIKSLGTSNISVALPSKPILKHLSQSQLWPLKSTSTSYSHLHYLLMKRKAIF